MVDKKQQFTKNNSNDLKIMQILSSSALLMLLNFPCDGLVTGNLAAARVFPCAGPGSHSGEKRLYKSSDITGGPVEKETACKWLLAKTAARFPLFTGLPLPGPVLVQCRIQLSIGLAGLRAAVHNNGGVSCYNNSHYTTALLRFCHTRGSNCGPFIQSVLGIRYTRLRFGK